MAEVSQDWRKEMSWKKRLYEMVGERIQTYCINVSYSLGLRPRVGEKHSTDNTNEYPDRRKAVIIFSADFEMAWGWRFSKRGSHNPLVYAIRQAEQTRRNFPELLKLFDRYNVPVTWATVGHLFLDRCHKSNGRAHPDLPRPPYFGKRVLALYPGRLV